MIEQIKENFLIKHIRKIKYEKKFKNNNDLNLFKGVYSSFNEAQAAIPKEVNQGYDNEKSAMMYKDVCSTIVTTDYPNLFWLSKILKNGMRLFDLGGHIGVKYYSYQKYINFPKDLSWTVYDLPAVVEEGKKWAKQQNATALNFAQRIDDFDGADILFASGSLQYVEFDLAATLKNMKSSPKHIIISIPLTPLPTFYSVNNIITAYCVYILRNEQEFISGIVDAGYSLVDKWVNEGKRCEIPFYPEHSIEGYRGLYFTKI
ncbi:MAG: methyltransferase, TIGR04325 family [Bacteriovoracaceae bacterium]|nr:methyltransferase, TIGR04325 family [Bacteriovoracaceae bacterium]